MAGVVGFSLQRLMSSSRLDSPSEIQERLRQHLPVLTGQVKSPVTRSGRKELYVPMRGTAQNKVGQIERNFCNRPKPLVTSAWEEHMEFVPSSQLVSQGEASLVNGL